MDGRLDRPRSIPVRPRLSSRPLEPQAHDHRVRRRRELGELVAGCGLDLDVVRASADGHQAIADRLYVAQDRAGHELSRRRRRLEMEVPTEVAVWG